MHDEVMCERSNCEIQPSLLTASFTLTFMYSCVQVTVCSPFLTLKTFFCSFLHVSEISFYRVFKSPHNLLCQMQINRLTDGHADWLISLSSFLSSLLQGSRRRVGDCVAGSNQGKPRDEGGYFRLAALCRPPRLGHFSQCLSWLAASGSHWDHTIHSASASHLWASAVHLPSKPWAPEKVHIYTWGRSQTKQLVGWKAEAWAGFLLLKLIRKDCLL